VSGVGSTEHATVKGLVRAGQKKKRQERATIRIYVVARSRHTLHLASAMVPSSSTFPNHSEPRAAQRHLYDATVFKVEVARLHRSLVNEATGFFFVYTHLIHFDTSESSTLDPFVEGSVSHR
jgi:hypothetical protein